MKNYEELELLTASIFDAADWKVTRDYYFDGLSIDVFAKKEGVGEAAVECKAFSKLLGVKTARQIVEQAKFLRASNPKLSAWVVTTKGCTQSAQEFLTRNGVSHYTPESLAKELSTSLNAPEIYSLDKFLVPNESIPKRKKVFVAMPFKDDMTDVYYLGYLWAAEKLGLEICRLDEMHHSDEIVGRLNEEINSADIIIGDTTGGNANVLYEIGYATAKDIPLVLTCKKGGEPLPFDIRGRSHIFYKNIVSLREPLKDRLKIELEKLET